MKKYFTVITAIVLLASLGAASQHGDAVEASPGIIGADSVLYGLEIAMDNAGMAIGLKKAGDIAQERAAEARDMEKKNNTDAMMKAVRQMNAVAEKATADDTQGIEKARTILETLQVRATGENRRGLENAVSALDKAQSRAGGTQAPNETGDASGTAPADEPGSGDFDDTPGDQQGPSNGSE